MLTSSRRLVDWTNPLKSLPIVSATCFLSLSCGQDAAAQRFYYNGFEQYEEGGVYTEDDLDIDWGLPVWEDGVREGRVSIVKGLDAFRGKTSLAVLFPQGGYGTKRGGAQWQLDFPESYKMVRLRYRVKFGAGFDFVRGGKLPGLAGGTAPTGNTTADGFNGWTGRLMWRTDYEGEPGAVPQPLANVVTYLKHSRSGFDGSGRNEDNIYWLGSDGERIEITSGVWYRIVQTVKMNDRGRANGQAKTWLDGVKTSDVRGLKFRKTDDFGVDLFYFSTFFGGGNSDWAPSKDEVIYFDDFDLTIRQR